MRELHWATNRRGEALRFGQEFKDLGKSLQSLGGEADNEGGEGVCCEPAEAGTVGCQREAVAARRVGGASRVFRSTEEVEAWAVLVR